MVKKKEGFFSSLFKDRRAIQSEKDNLVLQNMLDKKDRIISELQGKLNIEIEKRKKSEIFLKQSEIIQRNLENKDKKNKELYQLLESTQKSFQAITSEKDEISKKYNVLVKNLDEAHKENTTLKETHKSLEEELVTLNRLKEQGDQMQIVGDVFLSRDKTEEIQEENTSIKNLCAELRTLVDDLEEKNKALKDELDHRTTSVTDLKNRLEKSLTLKEDSIKYRLPLRELLCSTKFSDVIATLEESNIRFIDETSIDKLSVLLEGVKNGTLAVNQIENFNHGKYNWDTKTYICKGPRLSKVFSRQRKLLNFFAENYMEFLVDLETFDFDVLLDYKFTSEQISSFKEKLEEYNHLKI